MNLSQYNHDHLHQAFYSHDNSFDGRPLQAADKFSSESEVADALADGVTLLASYRSPFNWEQVLNFFAERAIAGVEAVRNDLKLGGIYLRTVDIDSVVGWLAISHQANKQALAVTVSPSLLPLLERVLARVRFLFDLNADPSAISKGLASFDSLSPGLHVNGIRVPGCFNAFEMAVRAILGQQISIKAAQTLARRFAATLGTAIKTPFHELTTVFPSASMIALIPDPVADTLGPLGITGNRCRSIKALAKALCAGTLSLSLSANVTDEMQHLSELPGFGAWTINYVAMRALGWPDAFPHTDYGVKKALSVLAEAGLITSEQASKPKQILKLSEAWQPWRSYATLDLWHSLREQHK